MFVHIGFPYTKHASKKKDTFSLIVGDSYRYRLELSTNFTYKLIV